MGISPTNIYNSSNYAYSAILPPFQNRAEITAGMVRTPYATALGPSNTAAATNANPLLSATPYTSSAAVLEQNSIANANTIVNSNAVTSSSTLESGSDLQNALNIIAQQTPGSKFSTEGGLFSTTQATNTRPQSAVSSNTQAFSPISVSSNGIAQTNIFDSKVSLTGMNASVSPETSANFASVNANFGVQYSQQGSQALQTLQNLATVAAYHNTNVNSLMDGRIPISPFTPSDTGTATSQITGPSKTFDLLTDTFNHIMQGGGQGGSGGLAFSSSSGQENPEGQKQKKPFNQMA